MEEIETILYKTRKVKASRVLSKPKPKTVGKLKKELWALVSQYVRTSVADQFGMVTCVTCGRRKHYKQMHAGHFIPGRHNAVLFDIRGIHPQCYGCNVVLGGNARKYDKWMKENMGQEVIDDLDYLDSTTVSFTESYLIDEIKKYKKLLTSER